MLIKSFQFLGEISSTAQRRGKT